MNLLIYKIKNQKTTQYFLVFVLLAIFLILPFFSVSQAEGDYGLKETGGAAGLNTGGSAPLPEIIGKIIGVFLSFLGVIFFVLIIYGGFMWMTAAGNNDQITKAKSVITSAAIGLLIILSAYVITYLITTEFQGAVEQTTWQQLNYNYNYV